MKKIFEEIWTRIQYVYYSIAVQIMKWKVKNKQKELEAYQNVLKWAKTSDKTSDKR